MHLIMSLACSHESLNSMQSPNLFIRLLFLCLQKIPQGPFCKRHGNCSGFPRKAPCIVELPQHLSVAGPCDLSCSVKWAQSLLPRHSPNYSFWKCLCGSRCTPRLQAQGNFQERYSWIGSPPVTISPAPCTPLWQTWERKAHRWRRSDVSDRS